MMISKGACCRWLKCSIVATMNHILTIVRIETTITTSTNLTAVVIEIVTVTAIVIAIVIIVIVCERGCIYREYSRDEGLSLSCETDTGNISSDTVVGRRSRL